MKYVSIDIETTGLNTDINNIIEFAAILDDLEDPKPYSELPKYHCIFKQDQYMCQPVAASMHKRLFDIVAENDRKKYTFISPMKLGKSFKQFLQENGYEPEHQLISINVAGKNFASFDKVVLEKQTDFTKHIRMRSRILDPGPLYMTIHDEKMPSLEECKKRAGLTDPKVTHEAFDDALDVIKLFRRKMIV